MNGLQWELYSTRKPLGDYNCHGKSENTNTIYGYHAIIFVIAVILGLSYSIFIFPLRISRKCVWVIQLYYGSSVPARTGKQWFYIHIS